MLPPSKKVVTLSESQPDYVNGTPPVTIRKTMKHGGVLYVAGEAPAEPMTGPRVMVITPALEEEEATQSSESIYGYQIREKAQILKGGIGGMVREAAGLGGIGLDTCYVTTMIKWLLPRAQRNKPSKEAVNWAMPALADEIREVKPDIIVCMGKIVFDQLVDVKLSQSDALGGWFWSKQFGCRIFLMEKPIMLHMKPEKLETFKMLFKEVRNQIDRINGITLSTVEQDYRYIRKIEDLDRLISEIEHHPLASVDCEWGGGNFVDGKLRSIQFAWLPGRAAAVKFMDERKQYIFDASYAQVGKVLGRWMNKPTTRYIAHYASADLPRMSHWLGLDWYNKVAMDTAFALQTVDENAGMGLETLSMAYSDLGRYDLELMLWRKMNKPPEDDGFATIPDAIIDPYSCMDVDVPLRAYPWLMRRLEAEDLCEYFFGMFQPFVTNVFTSFVLHGLPMDIPKMDELRDLFHFAREQLDVRFQKSVANESWSLLLRALIEKGMLKHRGIISDLTDMTPAQRTVHGIEAAKKRMGTDWAQFQPWIQHCIDAPMFNIRSKPQMVRWLFEVKGHTPIKSTDNKEKGLRSMPWEKVIELPLDKQKEFAPATDKQTLQILAERDPLVNQLLDLNVVGNLCKAFLKEPELDEETGEVTKENGLHFWLCSDGRVHGQMATTETGRPRAWKPNSLNWPSYVNERISLAITRVFMALYEPWREDGWTWDEEEEDPQIFTKNGRSCDKSELRPLYPSKLPERWLKYVVAPEGKKKPEAIPSVRSVVRAIDGWCIVESDYQTAEIRGLAYLSGDPTLIRFMDEVDPTYGVYKDKKGNKHAIRLTWEHESISGIPAHQQDPNCIMALWVKGKFVQKLTLEDLEQNGRGGLKHPKYDLHWSLAEMVYEQPREKMISKLHRQVGKVG